MYSPVAAPPNHHSTISENPTPMEIHAADSMAASLVLTACASRCTTSRSTSSRATMIPSSVSHCQAWTLSSTKLPLLSAASEWCHQVLVSLLGRVSAAPDDRLGRGEAGDRHTER